MYIYIIEQGSEVVQYLHEQMDLWTLFSHDCKSTAYNMFCNNALHTTYFNRTRKFQKYLLQIPAHLFR